MSQQKEKRFIKKKINGKTKNGKYPGSKNQKRSKYLGNGQGLDFAIILKSMYNPSYNHFKAGDEMEIIVDENLVLKEKKGCKYYIKTYLAIN